MLELAKEFLVNIVQEEPLAPIYVKANASSASEEAEVAAGDDAFEEQNAASGTE
jgi:segregation and condensation protein A